MRLCYCVPEPECRRRIITVEIALFDRCLRNTIAAVKVCQSDSFQLSQNDLHQDHQAQSGRSIANIDMSLLSLARDGPDLIWDTNVCTCYTIPDILASTVTWTDSQHGLHQHAFLTRCCLSTGRERLAMPFHGSSSPLNHPAKVVWMIISALRCRTSSA